jgi:heavy metal translocating P-type ATPase
MAESPLSVAAKGKRCSLCGLPLGRSAVMDRLLGRAFCCPGCKAVYQILLARHGEIPEDPTQTELYRECLRAGIVLPGELREGEETPPQAPSGMQDTVELVLHVSGMGCPACAWLLEKVLRNTKGVGEVRVSFGSDRASILYDPSLVAPREILARIASFGYKASTPSEGQTGGREGASWVRLGVSAVLTAHVMMISWALYAGFLEELSEESVRYLSLPLLALSTPVVFWCGLPVLKKGLLGISHLLPNLESLVGLGAVSAYTYSLGQFLSGSLHLYFDTASMLVTLVLVGKHLEERVKRLVQGGLRESGGAAFQKARLVLGESQRWVQAREVKKGDLVLVEEGEGVPVDGLVEEGKATLDLSALSGESRPVRVREGELVLAGSLLLEGAIAVRARDDADRSLLASMASMVEEGLSRPSAWERLADRLSRWFVPCVVGLAGVTVLWIWWKGSALDHALMRGLTVLVIACPCALGVATPLARVAAVGLGRRLGIWIKDPRVLEGGGRIQAMLLDKTGTLTQGTFSVRELLCFGGEDPRLLLLRASSVELPSGHFLARQIVAYARERKVSPGPVQDFQEAQGEGVCGVLDGVRICVGNRAWMARWGLELSPEEEKEASRRESEGATVVFMGWDGRARGALVLGDALKPGAAQTVSALKRRGLEIWLVSGDSPETTSSFARQLGVERFVGGALPQEKALLVEKLSRDGLKVAVVGDGINDAPALTLAHLGIALGNSMAQPGGVASIHAARTDPGVILDALEILGRARRTVLQNLLFSLAYNLAAIAVAVAGLLNPPLAVLAMFASSLTVIGNSTRLARGRVGTENRPAG